KTTFFCQNCGSQSPVWIGKCASCGEWNTYVEELVQRSKPTIPNAMHHNQQAKPISITELSADMEIRHALPDNELTRVLGGGIVQGSVILFGGEPGIGKSTLMLQLLLSCKDSRSLYLSGEESSSQIRMRAERIGGLHGNCTILTETDTSAIFQQLGETAPDILVVDSIQTLSSPLVESSAGSISQIRQCAAELIRFAKETGTTVFLIGHITKEGYLAGPKVLEHMVDVVLQFEGDSKYVYRLLRAVKNRFGSTNELGIYEMNDSGLREVHNPSEMLISHRDEDVSGIAIAATVEGMRPFLIEVQALVSTAVYGTPQRSATGFDLRRLNMLLAVLEKRCGFKLGAKDVFLNIAGGIRVDDPAIDLAVVCAILSSGQDVPIDAGCCFSGEVGLTGEIRPVSRLEQRMMEAGKLGFSKMFISSQQHATKTKKHAITPHPVTTTDEVFNELF
ncbi:MAG: DNA repair protein RadA, partial [Flavobacteriales bacterium]